MGCAGGAIDEDGFFAAFEENAVWAIWTWCALKACEATRSDITRRHTVVASLTG